MKQQTIVQIALSLDFEADNAKNYNRAFQPISILFNRLIKNELPDVERIRLELLPSNSELKETISAPSTQAPRVLIRKQFDFNTYDALTKYKRRQYITETLYQALQSMCTKLNYDCQPFHQAYEKVKELDYQNAYTHGKLKASPDRQHKAGIHIRVEEEYAEISALVQDKDGTETSNIPLIRTLPHYLFIYKFIHTTQWLDKAHFQVSDKSGQVVFGVNLSEKTASMQLLPKTMGLPELVQEVGMALAKSG